MMDLFKTSIRFTLPTVLVMLGSATLADDRTPPPWLNSREGVTGEVLPPWTPVKVDRSVGRLQVQVWGRKYDFEGQVFLAKVESKSVQILAGPIRLLARVNDIEVVWQPGATRLVDSAPARVTLATEIVSENRALQLSATTVIEYDGTVRVDWRLRAASAGVIQQLTCELRFPQERARYFYAYRDYLRGIMPRGGALPATPLVMRFNPLLWVSDDERGLAWFCESDEHWSNPEKAIAVTRESGVVVLQLRLIDKPAPLAAGAEFRYTFGFQATPVKPVVKDQWDYRIVSAPIYGGDYQLLKDPGAMDRLRKLGVHAFLALNWTEVMCHTTPVGHKEDFRRLVSELHQRGIQVIPYIGNQISELAPEWKDYGMKNLPELPQGGRQPDRYPGMTPQWVNYALWLGSLQDFLVDGVARLVDEYDVDGVYYDGTICFGPSRNRSLSTGYVAADGTVKETYPIFAYRDFARRLYTAIKSRKPDGVIDVHTANFMAVPSLAYATGNWDGEWFDTKIFTMDSGPLDILRAQFTGRQLGVPVEFLHYTILLGKYRQALAYSLLHDIPVRAHGGSGPNFWDEIELLSVLWRVMDEFDRKGAEWLPYWRNEEYVKVVPSDAFVSLYRHPRHGVLAVISHLGKQRVKVEARFDLGKLGLPPNVSAMDAITKDPVAMEHGSVALDLDSVDWKLVWIRK